MAIDLHLHTQASDGTWSPRDIVQEVIEAGLTAFAVTDHDVTGALEATASEAAKARIPFIPGVEISSSYTPEISLHILGYGIEPSTAELQRVLRINMAAWEKSEQDSIVNLAKLGIDIDPKRYEYWRSERLNGGWPLLNALQEMGVVKGLGDYFINYFGLGKPAYVEILFISPAEAIQAIHHSGGVPVLAHPGLYKKDGQLLIEDTAFMEELIGWGIEGLEAFNSAHTPEIAQELLEVAARYNLLVTGGSDCHGGFAPGRSIGVPKVEDTYLGPLKDRMKQKTVSSLA